MWRVRETGEGDGVEVWANIKVCCSIVGGSVTEIEDRLLYYEGHEAVWRDWYLVGRSKRLFFSLST